MTWRPVVPYMLTPPALPVFEFDKQRVTCQACAHMRAARSQPGHNRPPVASMLCSLAGDAMSCSGERLAGDCGPEAVNFKPRENTP